MFEFPLEFLLEWEPKASDTLFPSEPVNQYVKKGGSEEATEGRKCLCNALMANIGLGQKRADGSVESALVTSGDDVADVAQFLRGDAESYRARDVIERLLEGVPE